MNRLFRVCVFSVFVGLLLTGKVSAGTVTLTEVVEDWGPSDGVFTSYIINNGSASPISMFAVSSAYYVSDSEQKVRRNGWQGAVLSPGYYWTLDDPVAWDSYFESQFKTCTEPGGGGVCTPIPVSAAMARSLLGSGDQSLLFFWVYDLSARPLYPEHPIQDYGYINPGEITPMRQFGIHNNPSSEFAAWGADGQLITISVAPPPPGGVPEPAVAWLLLLGAGLLMRSRSVAKS